MATVHTLIAKYGAAALLALATIGLIGGLGWFAYNRVTDAAYDRGVAARTKQFDDALAKEKQAAAAWKAKYEATSAAITTKTGEEHAKNVADVGARADALLVRGPGAAAACPRPVASPAVPGAAGGSKPAAGVGAGAVAGVHAEDGLVALPWSLVVQRARDADLSRAEALTWRQWYAEQSAAHRQATAP